jgi:hypothetical protein
MRVDSIRGALENMYNRKIIGNLPAWLSKSYVIIIIYIFFFDLYTIGTGDWKEVESILDVPEDTSNISFGISLTGKYFNNKLTVSP